MVRSDWVFSIWKAVRCFCLSRMLNASQYMNDKACYESPWLLPLDWMVKEVRLYTHHPSWNAKRKNTRHCHPAVMDIRVAQQMPQPRVDPRIESSMATTVAKKWWEKSTPNLGLFPWLDLNAK